MGKEKIRIGILGFSDGDPGVHEELKGIVQEQFDKVANALEQTGEVEVIRGTTLINSPRTAKEEALKMVAAGVHGVIFSYGVFSFPTLQPLRRAISPCRCS